MYGAVGMAILVAFAAMPSVAAAQSLQLSGGADGRATNEQEDLKIDGMHVRLDGLFLNLRKVWSDQFGDRWIGVAQADFDDNFNRIRPYQVYLQYKGPLGRWNVRAGHFLLPFGLLASYDTERLLLQGIERQSLGIRKDTGIMALGRFGSWDYSASITDGLADVRLWSRGSSPVSTGRLAWVHGTTQIGVSTLVGHVLLDPDFGIGTGFQKERRGGVDVTHMGGPLTIRGEATTGTINGRMMNAAVVLADYAITSKLELNSRYADWPMAGRSHQPGIGLTYQLRSGLFVRAADSYQFGERNHNVVAFQMYYEFSKSVF